MRYILALIAVLTLTAFGPCSDGEEAPEESAATATE